VDVDELAAKAATGQLWRLHFVVDELEDAVFEGVGENPVDVVWIASWRLPRSVKETEKL
jgi:hypothetical protein